MCIRDRLIANTPVYCAVSSCGQTANTSTYTVTVYAGFTAGSVTGSQQICYNSSPATFTQTIAPTGGDGTYTYQWQQQPGCTGSWSNISGATASTYTHTGNLVQNTCYRRLVSNTCGSAFSNTISGLAADYIFNGDYNDYSGNNINGTGTNTTWTTDRNNTTNSALVFSGGAYVSLNNPQNLLTDLSKFTISAWIKTTANSYQGRIVTLHYGSTAGSSISIMERSGLFDFCLLYTSPSPRD